MNLDTTTMTLEAVTATAPTTALRAHVRYHDVPSVAYAEGEAGAPGTGRLEYPGQLFRTTFNNTADVICPAPTTEGTTRVIDQISLYNISTDPEIITVQTNDGTVRELITQTLTTLQSLHWSLGRGWDVAGA